MKNSVQMKNGSLTRLGLGAVLLALLPFQVFAQEARVTIRAVSDGAPIAGVLVTVGDSELLTSETGEVRLQLAIGEHGIRAERLGFAAAARVLTILAVADTVVVIEMTEEAVETEGIVVQSTRTGGRIEDEPLRIEVVSREEVEEKLLMTPGDIAMLLNETAGLRVQPTAPSLGGASVRIQGLRGRYTQILSDGLPLYGGQAGSLGPLQIPPMDLAQVEVIKGAASALYGSTALGGVVNLISRTPQPERELLLNQSTLGGSDVIAWLADDLNERWGYTLMTSVHRQSMGDVDRDGWADLPSYRRASARPRLFWRDERGSSAFLTFGGMIESREGGTLPGALTPAGSAFAEELETRRLDAGLVARMLYTDTRSFSVRGSAMTQRHDHLFGERLERDRHSTAFVEASLTGHDRGHVWVAGVALQLDRYRSRDVPVFDFDYTVPALFLQDEYSPVDWLTVSGSARLDSHSEYGTFASPRVSLLIRPGEWVVRASSGSGYYAPTPFTEETEAVGLARLEPYGDLEAERAVTSMIDVGRHIGAWELNASVFSSEVEHAVTASATTSGTLEFRNSAGPVRTWGTELLATLHDEGPIHLTATYVLLRSTEPARVGPGRREVPLTPRHSVGMVGAYEGEWGRAGVEFYVTGSQQLDENPYRSVSEAYVILGFLVERRFGSVRLFLNAENLLDSRQTNFDRLVRPAPTLEGRWITDVWAPLEGRSFNAGVRLVFGSDPGHR